MMIDRHMRSAYEQSEEHRQAVRKFAPISAALALLFAMVIGLSSFLSGASNQDVASSQSRVAVNR